MMKRLLIGVVVLAGVACSNPPPDDAVKIESASLRPDGLTLGLEVPCGHLRGVNLEQTEDRVLADVRIRNAQDGCTQEVVVTLSDWLEDRPLIDAYDDSQVEVPVESP